MTIIDLAQGERLPQEIIKALTDDAVIKWAFNANFERVWLSRYFRDLGVSLDPFHDNHPLLTECAWFLNTVKQSAQKKLRVAAYCRVSTDSEEQETSYEAQVTHYTEYIQKNPEWELAGIFADDGISGTNTKKRDEFNRMIDECMAGNIDMVITKSISRFARNTLDCLQYIRQLKDKNIPVYFEKEAINTLDAKGEVLITIMASLAQQESQSMSQNIKLGLQYRYQQGKVQVNHNRFLGYTKDDDGHLIIDPEQAEIVKRIYREYLESSSVDKIADGLMADGILTDAGKTKWHTSTINKILRNEKYMGDITEFDEALAKKLIEKITVFADHFTVEFKSGITIDIEA